jgi:hypothetical protein
MHDVVVAIRKLKLVSAQADNLVELLQTGRISIPEGQRQLEELKRLLDEAKKAVGYSEDHMGA